ncbi:hypothetical protein M8J77_009799 [Diaphorina citri]|nr:hypothetical protein M8J77_009799 [Diaphorina citri]
MTKYHRTVCLLSIAVAILTLEIKGQTTIAPQKPTTPKLSVAQNLNKAAMECQSRLGVNQGKIKMSRWRSGQDARLVIRRARVQSDSLAGLL